MNFLFKDGTNKYTESRRIADDLPPISSTTMGKVRKPKNKFIEQNDESGGGCNKPKLTFSLYQALNCSHLISPHWNQPLLETKQHFIYCLMSLITLALVPLYNVADTELQGAWVFCLNEQHF